MNNSFSRLQRAARIGLDKVAGPKPPSDIEIYETLKQNKFAGVIDKYGLLPTLAYIKTMELKKERQNARP